MKKLMVAAAIVCAAVGIQAAQFDWSFNVDDDMGDYGEVAGNATYYLVNGDSGVGATLAGILTTDGADAFTAALADYSYQSGSLVNGDASGRILDAEKSYAAIFILNDGLVADKGFAYNEYDVSEGIYTPPSSEEPLLFYASDYGDGDYAAAWGTGTVAAVPEPTSGLLLLLGVAGLALRRRRA